MRNNPIISCFCQNEILWYKSNKIHARSKWGKLQNPYEIKCLIQVILGQKTEIFQGKECALYDTAMAYTGHHAFLKSHIQHQKWVLIQAVDLKQQCVLMGVHCTSYSFHSCGRYLGEQNALQEERLIFTWFQRASGACDSTTSPYGASREIETVKSAPKDSPHPVTYFF